jgi:hypothetical protein
LRADLPTRLFGLLVGGYILRRFVGGVLGSSPQNSILIHCGLYICVLFEPVLTLEYGLAWWIPPDMVANFWRIGGLAPTNPFSNFEFGCWASLGIFLLPHGGHSLAHVTLLHGHATSPLPRHLSGGFTVYHMVVQTTTWHFPIGPRTDRKIPKSSDMW